MERQRRHFVFGGILLGVGFGGFFDGIVFHQILQWHHMVSHVDRYPMKTVAGLEANTLADGLFHAAAWCFAFAGLFLLWGAMRHPDFKWSTARFLGLMLIGWGLFNLVEGVIDHEVLQLHHVKENSQHRTAWDIAFLAWGAVMLAAGWLLQRPQPHSSQQAVAH
jgi:uncharacterized membrane protein